MPLKDVRVPATDRAFLFGDGVYEVIRVYNGTSFLFEEHLARLQRSLSALDIAHSVESVRATVDSLLAKAKTDDGYIYIQVTRGAAPLRAHTYSKALQPNEFVYIASQTDPLASFRERGISVILHEDIRWHRPDIKSVNLLPNTWIRQKAAEKGCQEAILERWTGQITEATSSNVFMVKKGELFTPRGGNWILDGITRKFVLGLCKMCGIASFEKDISRKDLLGADEVFLSSTLAEIIAVTSIEGTPVSGGTPENITRKLAAAFRKEMQSRVKGACHARARD
jgi:D-alanine transaminase